MDLGFRMHAERTPNPNSIKWVLSATVVEGAGSAHFGAPPTEGESPLAAALFRVHGVEGVFLGASFVTVTKNEAAEWTELAPPIVEAIKGWAASETPALGPDHTAEASSDDSETVRRIGKNHFI